MRKEHRRPALIIGIGVLLFWGALPAARSAHASYPEFPLEEGTIRGRLEHGDENLVDGEYVDYYELPAEEGQKLRILLESEDFDSYLIVVAPSGKQQENDDETEGQKDSKNSRLECEVTEAGRWRLAVTSCEPGETGEYLLTVETLRAVTRVPHSPCDREDRLTSEDDTREDGQYVDYYTIDAESGQFLKVEMCSSDFDTYLVAVGPSGQEIINDDSGREACSLVFHRVHEGGLWRIQASSFSSGSVGHYRISFLLEDGPADAGKNVDRNEKGYLGKGDETLESGEYVDSYSMDLVRGDLLTLDLESEDFNPYLILVGPGGIQMDNEEFEGSTSHSRISRHIPETGAWRIAVTTAEVGQTGRYHLTIQHTTWKAPGK